MSEPMTITLNGDAHEVPTGVTVAELLKRLDVPARGVAVERNHAIAPKSAYETMTLQAGDHIEIVTFVGGG